MKKILPIAIAVIITGLCCTKRVSTNNSLVGSWELRSWYGGYSATGGGTLQPGNGNIYSFTGNTYRYYENNVLRDSGNYIITTGVNPNTGDSLPAILFNNAYKYSFSLSGDKLTMYVGTVAADGVVNTYQRITNAGQTLAH
jgi:hypothetical protein